MYADFAKQNIRSLAVNSIITNEQTQSRMIHLGKKYEREEAASQSRAIVEAIRISALSPTFKLAEPISVALVDGQFILVNGHHRLEGFKQAKAKKIQAYVVEMDHTARTRLTLEGNARSQSIKLSSAEWKDLGWQYVINSHDGQRFSPTGDTQKNVAQRFSMSPRTMGTMVSTLKIVKEKEPTDYLGFTWGQASAIAQEWGEPKEGAGISYRELGIRLAHKVHNRHEVVNKEMIQGLADALGYMVCTESDKYWGGVTATELVALMNGGTINTNPSILIEEGIKDEEF